MTLRRSDDLPAIDDLNAPSRALNGWDSITLTESYLDKIAAFKTDDRTRRPWAAPTQSR